MHRPQDHVGGASGAMNQHPVKVITAAFSPVDPGAAHTAGKGLLRLTKLKKTDGTPHDISLVPLAANLRHTGFLCNAL